MREALGILSCFLWMGLCSWCVAGERPSSLSYEQNIPLSVILPNTKKAACSWLKLAWKPMPAVDGEMPLRFHIEPGMDAVSEEALRSSLSVAVIAAATACQQPWEGGEWMVSGTPLEESASIEAALSAGLIAAALQIHVPRDTLIMGKLYPDGCMGPVSQVKQRIEAAASVGIKRIILSSLQSLEIPSDGKYLDIGAFAESQGLDCFFVDHLSDAVEIAFHCKLPLRSVNHSMARYRGKLFSFLDAQCKNELRTLESTYRDWPRDPRQMDGFSLAQQDLWKEIFRNYHSGRDAYRAGWLYAARGKLREANFQLKAVVDWGLHSKDFASRATDKQVVALRQKIVARLEKAPIDRDDLQSGLVMAEEQDWLCGIDALLGGAQILARQVFASRSHASETQKRRAQNLLWIAIEKAERELQDLDFYPALDRWICLEQPNPIPNRARFWLPQLLPASFAAAEFLSQGLRVYGDEYRESLLFDSRLAAHTRTIRDLRSRWDQDPHEEKDASPSSKRQGPGSFMPGPAYAPPVSLVPFPSMDRISSTARVLSWVNQYCETAFLEEKYLGPSRLFGMGTENSTSRSRTILQRLLGNADLAARRGIAAAEEVHVQPGILDLIYERACFLRMSDREEDLLEALRQYWRCSLLGNWCWQLAPRALEEKPQIAHPARNPPIAPAPSLPIITISPFQEPLAPWMEPSDPNSEISPDVPLPAEEPPPLAVPAIPISPEELNEFQNP